ncbi:hypothetical protein NL676_036372 [Syzygium grande]|nr:hypothetical protein NL676_036372 [Syzygium grande]
MEVVGNHREASNLRLLIAFDHTRVLLGILGKGKSSAVLSSIQESSVDVLMETKGGKKSGRSSRSSNSLHYEVPLGYCIEDVRPNGGIEKFRSAAYSDCLRKPS